MILYTIGGTENLMAARSYFSNVLRLHPGNIRAHVGLAMV